MIDQLLSSPLATVIDYYASCLHEQAKAFLSKNAFSADNELKVGFCDRSLCKQLPSHRTKAGREARTEFQDVGVLKPTGHETFRGFVTVPLTNIDGEVTGIYGMRIDRKAKGEKIITIGDGLFNAKATNAFDEIIVCNDVLDAWTFYAAGHKNAVVAKQLKKEHVVGIKRVLVAGEIDHDLFEGKEILKINFPEGFAVNRFAKAWRTDADAFGKRIRAATWISGAPQAAKEESPTNEKPIASPVPAPVDDLPVDTDDHQTVITIENRRWRVRGLDRNTTIGVMKVNVMVFNERTDRLHVDTLDLCHARSRRLFLKECGEEISVSENELRSDVVQVLLKLEQLQLEQQSQGTSERKAVELTDAERSEALELLKDKRLLDRILDDFDACGIVGERIGKLTGYIAATSRLLPKPLGVVIQSSSAAGKTSLMNAVLSLMPSESQFVCSAMTGQSLYYAGNVDLRHKILSIAEEEGARNANYALKLLQSEGKLSIVTTAKESGTGRTVVERYDVEGPVATIMTTTASDVDPELMNRCLVISVDEDASQTAAIQARQRLGHTIDQQLAADQAETRRNIHRNAQRLLRPIKVDNRYADQLKFPCDRVADRRDNQAYMTLIDAIALLHQYQREIKSRTCKGKTVEYIEVTKGDIALANMIVSAIMGSSIDDLPTQTRRLLLQVFEYADGIAERNDQQIEEVRFTRRDLREALSLGQTQLKVHLDRLAAYEYVHVHPGPGRTQRYELRWDGRGREGEPMLFGLTDPTTLQGSTSTTPVSSGLTA